MAILHPSPCGMLFQTRSRKKRKILSIRKTSSCSRVGCFQSSVLIGSDLGVRHKVRDAGRGRMTWGQPLMPVGECRGRSRRMGRGAYRMATLIGWAPESTAGGCQWQSQQHAVACHCSIPTSTACYRTDSNQYSPVHAHFLFWLLG